MERRIKGQFQEHNLLPITGQLSAFFVQQYFVQCNKAIFYSVLSLYHTTIEFSQNVYYCKKQNIQ